MKCNEKVGDRLIINILIEFKQFNRKKETSAIILNTILKSYIFILLFSHLLLQYKN
jgi:hypothetical protein